MTHTNFQLPIRSINNSTSSRFQCPPGSKLQKIILTIVEKIIQKYSQRLPTSFSNILRRLCPLFFPYYDRCFNIPISYCSIRIYVCRMHFFRSAEFTLSERQSNAKMLLIHPTQTQDRAGLSKLKPHSPPWLCTDSTLFEETHRPGRVFFAPRGRKCLKPSPVVTGRHVEAFF